MSINPQVLPIDTCIEHITIKGQYTSLAAPITLTGQLLLSQLTAEYPPRAVQSGSLPTLQIGIDEAGRGPLLGSVHVAAAILPKTWSDLIENQPLKDTPLSILTDSKKLSEKKRDTLYPLIQQHALGYIIADIPAAVIDQLNILQATMLGMRLCMEELLEALVSSAANIQTSQVEVLIDGNRCPELNYVKLSEFGLSSSAIDCQAWVKGDARHTSIAAASVLAKVSRDQTMYALDSKHPEYAIAKHKGYPTKAHLQAIETHGVLDEHRRSFSPIKQR
ncbi:ribonuclease HII [uncultured Psychrobacter sp.]|uniref:ribonuclease HII n=1 Tax=uncultured Psychrobacter sp. TaxID=259303 RepID=UPI002615FE3F|nr:ribonuclease HII [uncultured Psychrobacter sp.]